MRFWIIGPHQLKGFAAVDQIINDQNPSAISHQLRVWCFEDHRISAILVVIALNADRIYIAHIEFAGHDHGRRHAAARDGHNCPP